MTRSERVSANSPVIKALVRVTSLGLSIRVL